MSKKSTNPVMFISEPVPEDFTMTFSHRNGEVGKIIITKNLKMEFSGNLEKSAIIFMNFIKPHIERWLKKKESNLKGGKHV